MTDSPVRRAGRAAIQLIASGGLTGLIAALANGLSAYWAAVVLAIGTITITWAQNLLEDNGTIPVILGTKEVEKSDE